MRVEFKYKCLVYARIAAAARAVCVVCGVCVYVSTVGVATGRGMCLAYKSRLFAPEPNENSFHFVTILQSCQKDAACHLGHLAMLT